MEAGPRVPTPERSHEGSAPPPWKIGKAVRKRLSRTRPTGTEGSPCNGCARPETRKDACRQSSALARGKRPGSLRAHDGAALARWDVETKRGGPVLPVARPCPRSASSEFTRSARSATISRPQRSQAASAACTRRNRLPPSTGPSQLATGEQPPRRCIAGAPTPNVVYCDGRSAVGLAARAGEARVG